MEISSKLWRKLPSEIFDVIISYSYSIQPTELRRDIRHYYHSKNIIFKLYIRKYSRQILNNENPFYCMRETNYWLIHDILIYTTNNNLLIEDYDAMIFTIWRRNPFLKTEKKIIKFVYRMDSNPKSRQINLFWGIFTIKEREEFMSHCQGYASLLAEYQNGE
jgi:hypothetical protein